jgi:hypothetical protein
MEFTLQGIYLRDSLLWIMLRIGNNSPIDYVPGYIHWCIRDRRRSRRTAIQDIVLQPVYTRLLEVLPGDSNRILLAGFRPFALPGDKELVLQLAERNGARELMMDIKEKEILKAKKYGQEEKEGTEKL